MAKKIVTLYIDDISLRLLVTKGKRIKKWAELPLEPGLVRSNVVINETEVAAKIKQLVKDQKVSAKRVIVGLSGLNCLSRPITLPQLPEAMLDEAVVREARRALPVPVEQLYISWQTIPTSPEKTGVFLVAIPHKTTDTLLKVLRRAGLNPYFMDIKPLALARIVKEPTAIIVDAQPNEFDIIIMTNGIPQPIRTVPLPEETLSWAEKLTLIRSDLDRTIKFYNSNNPGSPLTSSVPMYISGELANEPELCQSLSDEFGYPVLPLPSTLECPEQLDPSRYMANIGLALKELSSDKEASTLQVNLNALPAPQRPKPPSLLRVIVLPGAVVVIGLLVYLGMLIQGASVNIVSARNQLDSTNQVIMQKQLQRRELMNDIAELETSIAEAEAAHDAFTTALYHLDKTHSIVNGNLLAATQMVPLTVGLTNVSHAGGTLTIEGFAPSETEALSYAERLNTTLRFSEITVASVKRIDDEETVIEFTLILRSKE
jgi:type IV pilus assembly protein PilM